jgi:hypothetical protein
LAKRTGGVAGGGEIQEMTRFLPRGDGWSGEFGRQSSQRLFNDGKVQPSTKGIIFDVIGAIRHLVDIGHPVILARAGMLCWCHCGRHRLAGRRVRKTIILRSKNVEIIERDFPKRLVIPLPLHHPEGRDRDKAVNGLRQAGSSIKQYRKSSRSTHGALRPCDRDLRIEAEFRDASQSLLERNVDFHAREIRADAAVNTETERGMRIPCPVDDDAVRIGKLFRVAVGGGEREQHHLTGLERAPVDRGLLYDLARHGHGRIGPQKFLNCRGDKVGVSGEASAVVGMNGQVPQAGADCAPRGIDARDQQ